MAETDFPRNADAFKVWADRECTAWPENLTALAYSAHKAMEGHGAFQPICIDEFTAAYAVYAVRE